MTNSFVLSHVAGVVTRNLYLQYQPRTACYAKLSLMSIELIMAARQIANTAHQDQVQSYERFWVLNSHRHVMYILSILLAKNTQK